MTQVGPRVLLVEDNEDDYLIVRDLLADVTSARMVLEWVTSYETARAAFARGRYDVCLLDYRLGGRNGLDLLREFSGEDRIPIILLTGTEDYLVDVEATKLGAADYLLKGHINAPLLERSIRYAMQRNLSERALAEARRLAQATVDALPQAITVLSEAGNVVAVNRAWRKLAEAGGFTGSTSGVDDDYLAICESAATAEGPAVAAGIRAVQARELEEFSREYPCEDPGENRWFEVRVTRFTGTLPSHVVVTHADITARKLTEASLVASEGNLATAQRMAHLGSWEWELGTTGHHSQDPVRWSDETYRILGYEPGEIEASYEYFMKAVHPEDRAFMEEATATAIRDHIRFEIDHRILLPDGRVRLVHEQAVHIRDDSGKIIRSVGTIQDITERKATEVALVRMRDELEERVAERTCELERANVALQNEIIEREGAESETRKRARQQEAVAELGRMALTDIPLQTLLFGATGLVAATLDVEMTAILELEPDGKAFHICAGTGWNRDTVAELDGYRLPADARSQAGYTLMVDGPVIVSNLRTETRFVPNRMLLDQGAVNGVTVIVRGYERPFGVMGAHSKSQREFTLEDVNFMRSMSNVLAAAIERNRIESEIRGLNVRLNDTNRQLLAENAERQMALGALREAADVLSSAKEEAERAKEEAELAREAAEIANRAKSEFLSRMSHEFRTPLNAILGFGQLIALGNRDGDAQLQENADHIIHAGRHLLDLINEVLDISRIEAGRLSLSPEPVEIGPAVREVLELVRPLAASREIQIFNEIGQEFAGIFALVDRQRLKQVLLNYLSNAVKYNRDSGLVVVSCLSWRTAFRASGGAMCSGLIRITVRDTGRGISPDDLSRLFVPFERLDAGRTQIEGTGIGLALCKHLVEAMDGRVGAESELENGSAFWLELPWMESSGEETASPASSALNSSLAWGFTSGNLDAAAPDFRLDPRTILYIEDNPSNFKLIEQVFQEMGDQFRVMGASQGGLGLDLAKQHLPDLILLDVNLPDMRGDQVLRHLRENPATRPIPVLVLSADATPRQMDKMRKAGASHYLTKPLDIGRFMALLRDIFLDAERLDL